METNLCHSTKVVAETTSATIPFAICTTRVVVWAAKISRRKKTLDAQGLLRNSLAEAVRFDVGLKNLTKLGTYF
jgi:hypothetical protein